MNAKDAVPFSSPSFRCLSVRYVSTDLQGNQLQYGLKKKPIEADRYDFKDRWHKAYASCLNYNT